MTTQELEVCLMYYLDVRINLIVNNVTNMSSTPIIFETDILSLSKSGYASGYELKISKGDLKNDLKKKHIINLDKPFYKRYLNHFFKPLKYFYYVVPEELKELTLNQIPEYFGLLISFKDRYNADNIKEIRKAEILHNYKWNDKERYELARLGAMRILNLKSKLSYVNRKVERMHRRY